jgi:hypothetical protein
MNTATLFAAALLTLGLSGCARTNPTSTSNVERGPDGTIAYNVLIESSELGVRIEANQDYVGTTPVTLKIFGDKDGTFHNFGSPEYVIRALPTKPGQCMQTKVFRTGKWFAPEDMIPRRIFFDMGQPSSRTGAAPAPSKKREP